MQYWSLLEDLRRYREGTQCATIFALRNRVASYSGGAGHLEAVLSITDAQVAHSPVLYAGNAQSSFAPFLALVAGLLQVTFDHRFHSSSDTMV